MWDFLCLGTAKTPDATAAFCATGFASALSCATGLASALSCATGLASAVFCATGFASAVFCATGPPCVPLALPVPDFLGTWRTALAAPVAHNPGAAPVAHNPGAAPVAHNPGAKSVAHNPRTQLEQRTGALLPSNCGPQISSAARAQYGQIIHMMTNLVNNCPVSSS